MPDNASLILMALRLKPLLVEIHHTMGVRTKINNTPAMISGK